MFRLLSYFIIIFCYFSPVVFADLADYANDINTIYHGLAYIIKVCLWVGGAGLILGGMIQYRAHRVNPSQVRLTKPVMLWITGIVFILIPFAMLVVMSATNSASTP